MKKTKPQKRIVKYAGGRSNEAKTVNVARVNLPMPQETADVFNKIKTTISEAGPATQGDAPKPVVSSSLIFARMAWVYWIYLQRTRHIGGEEGLGQEFNRVVQSGTAGSKVVDLG